MAKPVDARDQWQIPRPDAPPTGPMGTGRSGGVQAGGQAAGSQLPGFTGGSYQNGVPGAPGFNGGAPGFAPGAGQVPGLVAPGAPALGANMPPSMVPDGKGVLPDFFKQIVGKRLPPGTVLTGIAESNLSSIKSQRGDVFSIILPHGYSVEGEEIIPAGSHILGVVAGTNPAATQRPGMPGKMSISLKTLVFPDGRTTNINGFIDHNPAHDQLKEPKTRFGGFNAGDYGNAFKGMLYSSVSGITWIHNRNMRGKEFLLKAGTPVSVKLNTTVDVAKMSNPTAPLGVPGMAQGGMPPGGMPPGMVPGLPPGAQGAIPGMPGSPMGGIPGMPGSPTGGIPGMPGSPMGNVPGAGLSGVPGIAIPQSGVPGMINTPPVVPQSSFNQQSGFNQQQGTFFPGNMQAPDQMPGSSFTTGVPSDDPNSIFKTPISSPQVQTPDPF